MKKSIFKKIGGLFLGLAMGLGVAVGVTAGNKASEVKAATKTYSHSFGSSAPSGAKTGTNDMTFSSVTWSCTINYTGSSNGWQLSSNNSKSTASFSTTAFSDYKIHSVSLGWYTNSKKYVTWAAQVGTTTLSEKLGNGSGTGSGTKTFDFSATKPSGKITISSSGATGGYAITSIGVVYEEIPTGFTLSYNANKPAGATGSVGNMPTDPTSTATSFTVDSKVPTLTGYTFKGWGTQSSGIADENLLQPGASTGTISQNTTLHAYWELNKYTVTPNITNGSLDDTSSIEHGGNLTVQILPDSGYRYPSVEQVTVIMGTTNITSDAYDADDGSILYEGVTGNISITATCPPDVQGYDVTWTGSNHVTIDGASKLYVGETNSYTITADTGYKLPEQEDVAVTGATSVYEKTAYNEATLTLSNPTGEVTISLAGIALGNYGVTFTNENNFIYDGPENIQEFGQATFELLADDHYDLPETVSVNGVAEKDVTYEKASGQLTISNPTGDVSITVNPVARERYGITVTGAGDSAQFFTYGGDTEIYQTETATVTIAPDAKGTDDIYVITADNINVDGATKGSYTNNVLTISNPTKNVTITVTPILKVLQSISITKLPSKTEYKIGETFDPTGITVTANYNVGSEPITSGLTYSENTIVAAVKERTPHTMKVYYGGMSAAFTIYVSPSETGSGWIKVTSTSDLDLSSTSKYLIVCSTQDTKYAFNGSLTSFDATSNYKEVIINDEKIAGTYGWDNGNAYYFNITASETEGKYNIKSASNKYFNSKDAGKEMTTVGDPVDLSISFNESGNVDISSSTTTTGHLAFNKNSGQTRFRFYTSGQEPIELYKYFSEEKKVVGITAEYNGTGAHYSGTSISLDDIKVVAIYNDGNSNQDIQATSISPSTYQKGTNTYEVSYGDFKAIVEIADVVEDSIKSIEIRYGENPTLNFGTDSEFNHNDVFVDAVYDSGKKVDVTEDCLFGTFDPTILNQSQPISVSYNDGEFTTSYNVVVSNGPILSIVKGRTIEGYVGESYEIELSLEGYVGDTVEWTTSPTTSTLFELSNVKGSTTQYTATITLKDVCAKTTLKIYAGSQDTSAEIEIISKEDVLTKIEVSTTKTTYESMTYFDTKTLTVEGIYSASTHDIEAIELSNCTITAVSKKDGTSIDLSKALHCGNYTITVSYKDFSDSFDISVVLPDDLVLYQFTKGENINHIIDDYHVEHQLNDGSNPASTEIADPGYEISKVIINARHNKAKSNPVTIKVTIGSEFHELNISGNVTADYEFNFNNAKGGIVIEYTNNLSGTGCGTFYGNSLTLVEPGEDSLTDVTGDSLQNIYEFIMAANEIGFGCDNSGTIDRDAWLAITQLPEYTTGLSGEDKTLLAKAQCGDGSYQIDGRYEDGTKNSSRVFIEFLQRYDYVVGKYNNDTELNYLSRVVSSSAGSRINPILALSNVDNSVWVISAVALVGLTAIGGYFFYRKRKENF